MADDFDIKDFTLGTAKTIRATERSGKQVPHHYIEQVSDGDYETVAASQTDQALGATGAAGDYLLGLLVTPASVDAGAVYIKDGAGSAITVFAGGTGSVSNLVPFFIPLGIISASGAWKVSTGASVSVIGIGSFT